MPETFRSIIMMKTNRAFCEVMISESGVAVRQTGQPKTKRVLEKKTAAYKSLQLLFEELKQRLLVQGLFDQEKKQALPKNPVRVAVITAAGLTASLRDLEPYWESTGWSTVTVPT